MYLYAMQFIIGIQSWLLSILLFISISAQQLYTHTVVSHYFQTELVQSCFNESKNDISDISYERVSYKQILSLNTFYTFTFHTLLIQKKEVTHSSYKVQYTKSLEQKKEYFIAYIHYHTKGFPDQYI